MSAEDHISLEGTLLMLDDITPHVAVPVQALCDGEVVATVLSDERGRYQFVDLKPGQYQLRCQILGGYMYYREERALRSEDGTAPDKSMSLSIKRGETLKNANLRFAPFKKGRWHTYDCTDGLAGPNIRAIHRDPDGVMWFGTIDGVSQYDGKTFARFTKEDGLAHNFVSSICRAPDGVVWIGTGCGVSQYDGKTFY